MQVIVGRRTGAEQMKGYKKHIAASIAITAVFVACIVSIGIKSAPAVSQQESIESKIGRAHV